MNSGTLWLAVITLAPIIIIFLLGANAATVFLSLCLGYVLYSFDSHNATSAINSFHQYNFTNHLKTSAIAINLVLLLAPAIITLLSQIKSMHGTKRFINLIPAIFCGLFAALIIVPALPASTASAIGSTPYWGKLAHYQADIVGSGAVVAIAFFWSNVKHHSRK